MKQYMFNDNTKLIFAKENNILIENKKTKNKIKLDYQFYERLKFIMKDKLTFCDDQTIFSKQQIRFLKKHLIIREVSEITNKYLNTKYEKFQIYLDNTINNAGKLDYIKQNNNKKVLFIGAGGICAAMIDYLISAGINNYGIVDFDIVEISNFNRQYKYKISDIGYLKTERFSKNLIEQYYDLKINIYNKKIESTKDLMNIVNEYNPDFIVCAADTPIYLINKYVAEACLSKDVPCIFGGVGQNYGVCGPLLAGKKSIRKYLKEIDFIMTSVNGIYPCKGSFGITNSLIANYMAKDVIFYFMGQYKKVKSLNKEREIDFERDTIYERKIYK